MTGQNNNNKSVSFGECAYEDAPENYALSQSQIESLWYTKEEMVRFNVETRMLLRRKERFDPTKDTWRGLEHHLSKNLTTQSRRDIVRTIVKQQHGTMAKQRGGVGLASLATQLSHQATSRAVMLAAKDMTEVRTIYQQEADSAESSSEGDSSSSTSTNTSLLVSTKLIEGAFPKLPPASTFNSSSNNNMSPVVERKRKPAVARTA